MTQRPWLTPTMLRAAFIVLERARNERYKETSEHYERGWDIVYRCLVRRGWPE